MNREDLIKNFTKEVRALQDKYNELTSTVFCGDSKQEVAVVLTHGKRDEMLDVISATVRSSLPIAEMLANSLIVAVLDALEGKVSEQEFKSIEHLLTGTKELSMKILVDNVPDSVRICKDDEIDASLEELKAINLLKHAPIIGEA